jgi:hypothetical protein
MIQKEKLSNPSAFPQNESIEFDYTKGMTLRDYYAAKAMQANLSIPRLITLEENHIKSIAKTSYQIADAMLKQREL